MRTFLFVGAMALLGGGVKADVAYTAPDPLDMRWTFGAHEPYTMYRRMGCAPRVAFTATATGICARS